MKKILFVCLGNICRSPSAEAIMNDLIDKNNLSNKIICDSAGLGGWHIGEKADRRMRKHAKRRDIDITSRARKFNKYTDFDNFDLIIGMDDQNIYELLRLARNENDKKKITRMIDYTTNSHYDSVPDPYYGGPDGFELVLDLLENACTGLLKNVINKNE